MRDINSKFINRQDHQFPLIKKSLKLKTKIIKFLIGCENSTTLRNTILSISNEMKDDLFYGQNFVLLHIYTKNKHCTFS